MPALPENSDSPQMGDSCPPSCSASSDTPETDQLLECDQYKVDDDGAEYSAYRRMVEHAQQMERERNEARMMRNWDNRAISIARQLERELNNMSDQCDAALQALEWARKNHERELIETKSEIAWRYGPWVLKADHDRMVSKLREQLTEAREQRDRLAEALKECVDNSTELLGERHWGQNEDRYNYRKRYDETAENIVRAKAALADALDAVKGGSHE